MGYWVDNTPRNTGDALVFSPGQEGASGVYGHVAVVEKVNPDGSIEISESNVQGVGVISHRTFTSHRPGIPVHPLLSATCSRFACLLANAVLWVTVLFRYFFAAER